MERGISFACLDSEILPQLLRRLLIHFFKIGHELLATGHHLEQSAARMKIFRVLLEMRRELLDLFGEQNNLILWRTSVLFVPFERSGHLFLLLIRQGHSHCVSNDRVGSSTRLHRAQIKISQKHDTTPHRFPQLLDFFGYTVVKNYPCFTDTPKEKNIVQIPGHPRTKRRLVLHLVHYFYGRESKKTVFSPLQTDRRI